MSRLRTLHRPDIVYFLAWTRLSTIPDLLGFNVGNAAQRTTLAPSVAEGWSTVDYLLAFPHEIGHMLGGWHEPAELANFPEGSFAKARSLAVRPYAFGHTDLTSCSKREGFGDLLFCPRTTMSYGVETWNDPRRISVQEPFYSSVRHKPNGWTIGLAGTSEVERVLHETVPVAVRSGMDVAYAPEQRPRTMTARWTGRDTVRVTWSEDGRSQDSGGTVWLALTEGANDRYQWVWDWESVPPAPGEGTSGNLVPLIEAGGAQIGVDVAGLRPGGRYRMAVAGGRATWEGSEWRYRDVLSSDMFELAPPGRSPGSPEAPSHVGANVTGPDGVRLSWRDNSRVETGYEVWWRKWSGSEPDEVWRRYGQKLRTGASSAEIRGLVAEEEMDVTTGFHRWDRAKRGYVYVEGETAHVGRYSFVVVAYNDRGFGASETLNYEFTPGPFPAPTRNGEVSVCRQRATGLVFDGYEVEMCVETPDGERRRVWDYELDADQSGLLYFFDRDNVEVLVKVLDGCGINGHRWVFVAPVTNLAFRLAVRELAPPQATGRRIWHYDSERRLQEELYSNGMLRPWRHGESQQYVGNAQGRTARTVSDTTAFPCTAAEIAAARAKAVDGGVTALRSSEMPARTPASLERLGAGAETSCEPGEAALTLGGGYTVSMCFETHDGQTGVARDWGLDSTQSGLMYFFDRNNAEVLIKVLDACGVNGYRWVFVAPVTDLAFNLVVRSPDGEIWTHTNRLGQTADAASDVSAFPCAPLGLAGRDRDSVLRDRVVEPGVRIAGRLATDDQFESCRVFADGEVRAAGRPGVPRILGPLAHAPSRHFVERNPGAVDQRPWAANRRASNLPRQTVLGPLHEVFNEHVETPQVRSFGEPNRADVAPAACSEIGHPESHGTASVRFLFGDFEAIGGPHDPRVVQLARHSRPFASESPANNVVSSVDQLGASVSGSVPDRELELAVVAGASPLQPGVSPIPADRGVVGAVGFRQRSQVDRVTRAGVVRVVHPDRQRPVGRILRYRGLGHQLLRQP